MRDVVLAAVVAGGIAGLVTNLLVPLVVKVAITLRAVDYPGGRKTQTGAVPRLGGVAILLGLAMGAGGLAMAEWNRWGVLAPRSELAALVLGTAMVFIVGLIDDVVEVSPAKRLLVEVAAAYLLVRLGWSFQVLRLPGIGKIDLGIAGGLVSLLWIVGVTNAINLIDGLDGLAAGVVSIIAGSLLIYAVLLGNHLTVILMSAVIGSSIGFLRHNWSPARIFMGDSGSLTLGFLLAVMSVHSALKAPAAVAILVPILALGVPVIDTLLVMAVRFLDRPQSPPVERFLRMFHADRNHLHHVLDRVTKRRGRVVAVIYGAVLACCAMALLVAVTGDTTLGLSLIGVEFVALLLMRNIGLKKLSPAPAPPSHRAAGG